ncbi:SWIM zinc finger family protein [Agathobaculum sp.]
MLQRYSPRVGHAEGVRGCSCSCRYFGLCRHGLG